MKQLGFLSAGIRFRDVRGGSTTFHTFARGTVALLVGVALASVPVALVAVSAVPASASATAPGVTLPVGPRPASVPANYLITPEGYFDPHCVYQVNANQVLTPAGNGMALVTIPASAVASARSLTMQSSASARKQVAYTLTAEQIAAAPKVPPCDHPRYDLTGKMVPASQQDSAPAVSQNPTINGWLESGSATLGAMSYLHAQWNVPAAPSNKSSQTVYFFPGFQNLSGSAIIMQPVLGWNAGGGIPGWSGASWNCCSVGNAYHSAFIRVTGSTISGDVGGSGCSTSTGVCSNWQIVTYDWGSGASTTFNTNAGGRVMNWTFGGVIEAYSVGSCNEFPGTSVTYSAFYLDNINGAHISTPSWTHNTAAAGTSPSCSYSVSGGTNVTLNY